MLKYILKRVLIFIPTLLAISLITFAISTSAPGDPVEQMLSSKSGDMQSANLLAGEKEYLEKRKELGLDLPIFYVSFSDMASPDTLHHIPKRAHRKNLERFIGMYGNWPEISSYYNGLRQLEYQVFDAVKDSASATPLINIKEDISAMYINHNDEFLNIRMDEIEDEINKAESLSHLAAQIQAIRADYKSILANKSVWKNYIPRMSWSGLKNQYHRWFFGDKPWFSKKKTNWTSAGFIRGDFGISYQDKRPVSTVLWDAVRWTILISMLSIFITYLIAIPLGVRSATRKGSREDQFSTTVLFILYSLPSFWIATMAILFLCGGDYLDWFPANFSPFTDLPSNASLFAKAKDLMYHLALPLVCWTYGSFAYLSRQMRGGLISTLQADFIRTARAKGLSGKKVIWKHALRNSLLPIITLFASVFPLAISGGIVLEIIFSIPGMGKVGYEAVISRNYPIVFAIMMFSAILTLVGYLVADILYAVVDPRISYSSKK